MEIICSLEPSIKYFFSVLDCSLSSFRLSSVRIIVQRWRSTRSPKSSSLGTSCRCRAAIEDLLMALSARVATAPADSGTVFMVFASDDSGTEMPLWLKSVDDMGRWSPVDIADGRRFATPGKCYRTVYRSPSATIMQRRRMAISPSKHSSNVSIMMN
ncbi:hypothetical protein B484DRAFT_90873 [Ochromonadaceae sp. CCMP2298]|nr:hypothetical protein B484DRAFT_90873 [Ochromonadaceae sp. CCMP2298]